MLKPLEIFNDIANGIILGVYDLAILIFGPLIVPLTCRRRSGWTIVLRAEERINSLPLLFACTALVMATYTGRLPDISGFALNTNDTRAQSFLTIFAFATMFTIVVDCLCRTLVFLRSFSGHTRYSKVRLRVLRLLFCTPLIGAALFTSLIDETVKGGEMFVSRPILFMSVFAIPYSVGVMSLTRAFNLPVRVLLAIPFSYVMTAKFFFWGWALGLVIAMFILQMVEPSRLWVLHKECEISDERRTLTLDADIILKGDYDAAEIDPGAIYAHVSRFTMTFDEKPPAQFLLRDKVVHVRVNGLIRDDWRDDLKDGTVDCSLEIGKSGAVRPPLKIPAFDWDD
ncbi:hypothetical protein [Rhizobium leguminosarum]|uniref:hypothetical protein n=1 Tax=Rhizobium leguminosarum TaxID=384 RepID=UPI003F94C89B